MARRDAIVIGASAGGLEALREIVSALPSDLPASILVVVHVPATATSVLPAILSRAGRLPAVHVKHGMQLEHGRIYVAPPDHHLLVHGGRLKLSRGPRVNNHRPAIDPLFFSAARWMGPRTIAVVLSGALDDGSAGARIVRNQGGLTIAQDPAEAQYAAMPQNAIDNGGVMQVLPAGEIAQALVAAVTVDLELGEHAMPEDTDVEGELELDPLGSAEPRGESSGFTCPDCHGALWEVENEQLVRFRCRIGHSYASVSLFAAQSEKLEEALWAGYRALEESAALAKKLADRARARGLVAMAERYESKHEEALERVTTLRDALERGQLANDDHDT